MLKIGRNRGGRREGVVLDLTPTWAKLAQAGVARLARGDDLDFEGGVNLGMEMDDDLVMASSPEGAGGQPHFLFVEFEAQGQHCFGDITGADGAKQPTLVAGLAGYGH